MAYDLRLASRLRLALRGQRGLTEMESFGGIGFLVRGNMACGVIGPDLLVRVGPTAHEEAIQSKGAKPFLIGGRASKGWVLVEPGAVRTLAALQRWVARGLEFVKTLPAK
jgi:TfoX/Sxy family transcriptional regulator of competence genes